VCKDKSAAQISLLVHVELSQKWCGFSETSGMEAKKTLRFTLDLPTDETYGTASSHFKLLGTSDTSDLRSLAT
jgi:hypothetical protein